MRVAQIVAMGAALALAVCTAAPGLAPPTPSPSLDPAVSAYLRANNATFQQRTPTPDLKVSSDQALKLVQMQTTGTVTSSSVLFGLLHDPGLGVRSDRAAWLVVLEGAAPPAPSGGPIPVGARRTFAFVDAEDGRNLEMFSQGAGP